MFLSILSQIYLAARYLLGLPYFEFMAPSRYSFELRPCRVSVYPVIGILLVILTVRPEFFLLGLIAHIVLDPECQFPDFIQRHLGKFSLGASGLVCGSALQLPQYGAIGILPGILLGWGLDAIRMQAAIGPEARDRLSRQGEFERLAMAMLATLAKVDGQITSDEIHTVETFIRERLQYDEVSKQRAIEFFRSAKSAGIPFQEYVKRFYQTFKSDPAILVAMVELLAEVAVSDGDISTPERRQIEQAGILFGLSGQKLQSILHNYEGNSARVASEETSGFSNSDRFSLSEELRLAYQTIGVSPTATDAAVKRAYRLLVKQYHPDTLTRRGLPKEFLAHSQRRFLAIQQAYETISHDRSAHRS